MEDLSKWLNEGKPQKKTKFINQILKVGEKETYIYQAVRKAEGKFGKTLHYIFNSLDGELIFDSKNPKHAEIFKSITFGSRVSIKKVFKDGRTQYEVKYLNSAEDEVF
ncbi:MAG: hypothetical protein WAQ07_01020 [Candidatus Omnitrophota bacterium]